MANKGLGKGFGSLLPQDFDQSMLLDKQDRIQKVAIERVQTDPNQPRRSFDQAAIQELAQSITRYGILQPLVVVNQGDGYSIVAGERRFRAAKEAGLTTVPVIVRTLKEMERLEISLIENVQRVDLNPIELAVSYAKLHEQFNMEYIDIGKRVGKANSTIVNIVRLLGLPDFVRDALIEKRITEGHARQFLALKSEPIQRELLKNIEQLEWTVRTTEHFVSEQKRKDKGITEHKELKKPVIDDKVSKMLSKKWGFKVMVKPKKDGGSVAMTFKDRTQLDEFLEWLERGRSN